MSILDEDRSKFTNNGVRYEYFLKLIHGWLPESQVLVSRCDDVACSECVGRKHNTKDGCPVCGELYMDEMASKWAVYPTLIANSVYKCVGCGSIIVSCGGGDVSAVGISTVKPVTEDDII